MKFFKKSKNKDAITIENGAIVHVDYDLLNVFEKTFVDDVRKLTDRHTLIQLMKVNQHQRVFFLEELQHEIATEQLRNLHEKHNPGQSRQQEIERKRARAEAIKQQAESDVGKVDKPAPQQTMKPQKAKSASEPTSPPIEKTPKTKPTPNPPLKPKETRVPEKVWLGQKGVKRGASVKTRGEENLQLVLDWLRHEPYSKADVMALVLEITDGGATKALDKMVKRGYLVMDQVPWVGEKKLVKLYGVSKNSLYLNIRDGDIKPGPRRDFKRGTAKDSNGRHTLNIQRARLYYQRIENPMREFRPYISDRDMPNRNDKSSKWDKYPDCLIKNSHLYCEDDPERRLTIALEIENDSKGEKYKNSIIKQHLSNIKKKRYDLVIYVRKTKAGAKRIEKLFNEYIEKLFVTEEERAHARSKFKYDWYDDLPQRIKEDLGEWRS